ncbi:MAG TPA: NFACT RNA binding domain-containing protein, partial [Abditibacteriaceae bacterium]
IFDSTILAAVASELQPLVGTRLRDIWVGDGVGAENNAEVEPRAVFLSFNAATVVVDTHPQRARLHLVENPPQGSTPLAFCDVLRKSLRGARLAEITQPHFDRVLRLEFQARDTIGNAQRFFLVVEIMERRSNVILLDEEEIIVDALKRLPPFLNRARTVLPHRPYSAPPADKRDPRTVTDWNAELSSFSENSGLAESAPSTFASALRARFFGISPLVAGEIESRISHNNATAAEACEAVFGLVKQVSNADASDGQNSVVLCGGQPYPFRLASGDCQTVNQSLSRAIEETVEAQVRQQALQSARAALLSHLARREKLNAAQYRDVERALHHAAEAETFKSMGNVLLANMPLVEDAIRNGLKSVEITDEWSGETSKIAIEPNWTPADNATRYFHRYKRAQKLGQDAPSRHAALDEEKAQLARWLEAASAAQSTAELDRIGRESGYAPDKKNKTQSRTRQQEKAARPESKLRQREFEGWQLWMGRSAEENQTLLSKVASPSDIWMHVRGMASAHVLIKNRKGQAPPPKVLQEGGRWVASAGTSHKNMQGELVEVIYTPAKWVRAVKGSPGRVTLQRFETLNVRL